MTKQFVFYPTFRKLISDLLENRVKYRDICIGTKSDNTSSYTTEKVCKN